MEKQLLIESSVLPAHSLERLPLRESALHNGVRCIAAYTCPISRPGVKNLNGRVYPLSLWDKIIREGQGNGTYALLDHPESGGGSVTNTFGVWQNVRFKEDRSLVLADLYLFGENGQHAHDALQAGGSLGISTVGFGSLLPDGVTVNPDDYEIERLGDWVLDPSGQVFATAGDELTMTDKELMDDLKEAQRQLDEETRKKKKKTVRKPLLPNTKPKKRTSAPVQQCKNPAVQQYVESQIAAFPALEKYRSSLLEHRNLANVQRHTQKLKSREIR